MAAVAHRPADPPTTLPQMFPSHRAFQTCPVMPTPPWHVTLQRVVWHQGENGPPLCGRLWSPRLVCTAMSELPQCRVLLMRRLQLCRELVECFFSSDQLKAPGTKRIWAFFFRLFKSAPVQPRFPEGVSGIHSVLYTLTLHHKLESCLGMGENGWAPVALRLQTSIL